MGDCNGDTTLRPSPQQFEQGPFFDLRQGFYHEKSTTICQPRHGAHYQEKAPQSECHLELFRTPLIQEPV